MSDKSYLTIEERLQKLEEKYDILYNSNDGLLISQNGAAVYFDIPKLYEYKEICVQMINTQSRQIFVRIPVWEFGKFNHHYLALNAINASTIDIIRVSPFWDDDYFYFAYDNFMKGIKVLKIIGIY